jgi:hypothetical protein
VCDPLFSCRPRRTVLLVRCTRIKLRAGKTSGLPRIWAPTVQTKAPRRGPDSHFLPNPLPLNQGPLLTPTLSRTPASISTQPPPSKIHINKPNLQGSSFKTTSTPNSYREREIGLDTPARSENEFRRLSCFHNSCFKPPTKKSLPHALSRYLIFSAGAVSSSRQTAGRCFVEVER